MDGNVNAAPAGGGDPGYIFRKGINMPIKTEGISAGEALVNLLMDYGVDTIFGIPGVHNVELYRGLKQSNIRHVLPRHNRVPASWPMAMPGPRVGRGCVSPSPARD